jgi:hypothetical protein
MLTWSGGGGSGHSCQKSNNTIEAIVLVSFKICGNLARAVRKVIIIVLMLVSLNMNGILQ